MTWIWLCTPMNKSWILNIIASTYCGSYFLFIVEFISDCSVFSCVLFIVVLVGKFDTSWLEHVLWLFVVSATTRPLNWEVTSNFTVMWLICSVQWCLLLSWTCHTVVCTVPCAQCPNEWLSLLIQPRVGSRAVRIGPTPFTGQRS